MNIGPVGIGFRLLPPNLFLQYSYTNTYRESSRGPYVPKVSLDMPQELVDDIKLHVGDNKKFVSLADAIRTACRKMLDQLDSIDLRHGRGGPQ